MEVFSPDACPRFTGAGQACVRNTVKNSRCTACVDACPTGAVTLSATGMIAINPQACIGCGYCFFNCPTGAVEGIATVQRPYRGDRLVMPLSAIVPCTEELLMWHSEYGIRYVEMEPDSASAWFQAIAVLNIRLKEMCEPLWSVLPPCPDALNGSRRRWLQLKKAGCASGSVAAGGRARRALFTQISEYRPDLDKDRCSLCGACVRVCPEKAIRLENSELMLNPIKCTGCGNCEAVCFEKAIVAHEAGSTAPTVYGVEQVRCRICHRDFHAWSLREDKCPVCRRHTFGMREA
ncbi:4Fe-4S binding protein [Rahnella woolbedingensis]|uniref:4Fe-4S dicluster domain-containing protein n=1 Tax=Rahnella woolbedingensis TaxID=1510574 RepID=A0A419N3F8_9GAMM|nr:4Fe-4S binding protein [Rahnella woolbedingensis]RJT37419.1 4Fe-4S dicluster domain-containing protein [Rahnella woolbedingensis]